MSGDTAQLDDNAHMVHVTFFADYAATKLRTENLSLNELRERILSTTTDTKDKLPWLKLAIFGDKRTGANSLRHDKNVLAASGIETDYDAEQIGFEDAVGIIKDAELCALLYTSPSHTVEKPRWRVLCPTLRELEPTERARMVARLNGLFGGVFSSESFTLSQAYYFGSVNGNPAHCAVVIDGDFIDQRDDLDASAIGSKRSKTKDGNSGAGYDDWSHLIENIRTGNELHNSTRDLSAKLVAAGMSGGAAVNFLRAEMQQSAAPRDERWRERFNDLPNLVTSAQAKHRFIDNDAKQIVVPVDLWGRFEPPTLPMGLLPPVIEQYAFKQSEMMGCDVGGLAMAALTICAAAVSDDIELQMKRHDPYWKESARLWTGSVIADANVQKARPAARSEIGKAVLQNIDAIELAGWSFLALIEQRLEVLRRQNTDEAHHQIAEYEDLKRRVEDFLGAASEFAANKVAEQTVVTATSSFVDGLKNIWARRHLQIADMSLLVVGVLVCEMAHPLSVVVAGTLVGGTKVVEAIKAAMGRDH